ncbi:DUF2911 domain-containing protein [Dyadobacter tibetensis]|uniref:DUF2911 domain-containing protein n=1 Tax=Dyadobacter tibetensis TaxID=1211851 RepID=UPI00046F5D4E|nr:DUF2911 domain-containing protein [Dyadobacter tibetensis]
MKKYLLSMLVVAGSLIHAQAQRTPQASPGATVTQTVGVTDFTVKYSRPGIKGRTAFADSSVLAPLNQLWRTGANAATILESSSDFQFGGRAVPAGKYAVFSIPSGGAWTVILNKNVNQGGTANYSQSEDVARIQVAPQSSEFTETFTIDFSNISDSSAMLNLSWASVKVPVPLLIDTETLTMAGLNKAVAEKPEDPAVLQNAAGYMLNKGKDLGQALSMVDKAIGIKETVMNLWLKAQILGKMGKVAEAIPFAQKALNLGESSGDPSFGFLKGQIEKGISSMQSSLPEMKNLAPAVKNKLKKKK